MQVSFKVRSGGVTSFKPEFEIERVYDIHCVNLARYMVRRVKNPCGVGGNPSWLPWLKSVTSSSRACE